MNLALKPFDQIVILPLPTTNRKDLMFSKTKEPASESEISESESESESELSNKAFSSTVTDSTIVKKTAASFRIWRQVQVVTITKHLDFQLPSEYLIGNGNIENVVLIAGGYSDDALFKEC